MADNRVELHQRVPPSREDHHSNAGPIPSGRLGVRGRSGGQGGPPPMPEQIRRPVWNEGAASTGLDVGGYAVGVIGPLTMGYG